MGRVARLSVELPFDGTEQKIGFVNPILQLLGSPVPGQRVRPLSNLVTDMHWERRPKLITRQSLQLTLNLQDLFMDATHHSAPIVPGG